MKSLEKIFLEYGLNEKEKNVASLVVWEGLCNAAIAKRILRSEISVKNYLAGVYRKFGVKCQREFLSLLLRKHQ